MEFFTTAILIIAILLPFLIKIMNKNPKDPRRKAGKQVPGPRGLPIIGNIHNILGPLPPQHYLRRLSSIYGPIFRLKLGEINTLIISSAEAAKEIMKTHDVDFLSRPVNAAVESTLYGNDNIFAGYQTEFKKQIRSICLVELLCAKRVLSFRTIREEETSHLLQSMSVAAGEAVDLSSKFADFSNDFMARAIVGGRCKEQALFQLAVEEVVQYTSAFSIFNHFPSIPKFILRMAGLQKKLDRCGQKLDGIAENLLQEHIQKRVNFFSTSHEEQDGSFADEDMMDVLIRIQQNGSLQFPLSNENIKSVINNFTMAGSETTSTTMEWMMTELVRHPEAMRKVQKEVRDVLGESSNAKMVVNEEAIQGKLHYLQLVTKETLRLHAPVPLLLPRENLERSEVMGYDIPAKTIVLVNAWAIGRDPKYWERPDEFWPERFEKSDVDFKGNCFEFLPFGSGRRKCPGINFSLTTMELAMAHLLYYFDWEYKTLKGEQLDLAESFGLSARRKYSLRLSATPHFPLPSV
ncbi:Premnaspirodiene oxygenase [Apostasia shenzhenica]|uniref:Premnaspirodiene oxygenase n=1 Tax=Apostasia shenzhenica TaxID=1088818 RepID=A0A2I0B5A7_9ASPA|nr:Premnaspirodiene oxygenase [Apostasia shenzhenica]